MTIQIDIHDVGHGACAVITCADGYRIMIDCGSDDRWSPSDHHPWNSIGALAITNLDEDHVADFGNVVRAVEPGLITANPWVDSLTLQGIKLRCGGMGRGITAFNQMLACRRPGTWAHLDLYRGRPSFIDWSVGWNSPAAFPNSTNNLSLLNVFTHGRFRIVFGGDLETAGWRNLLAYSAIATELKNSSILVAAHHGRENGQSDEAMRIMAPDAVVFSDSAIQHGTQESADDWYRSRVPGIQALQPFGLPPDRRHVFTTRRDGSMRIIADEDGSYSLTTKSAQFRRLPDVIDVDPRRYLMAKSG
ncbi:hypothetical protein [Aurantimonas sp.]|uniref:hypothetical protein n=1 Tax=Aurantimonas sp. TaxID=1872654 RepID=UPI0035140A95